MRKNEIRKTSDHELIFETIKTYSELMCNLSLKRSAKQLESHLRDVVSEMLNRNLLTKSESDYLLNA